MRLWRRAEARLGFDGRGRRRCLHVREDASDGALGKGGGGYAPPASPRRSSSLGRFSRFGESARRWIERLVRTSASPKFGESARSAASNASARNALAGRCE